MTFISDFANFSSLISIYFNFKRARIWPLTFSIAAGLKRCCIRQVLKQVKGTKYLLEIKFQVENGQAVN
jgi:hypothetical protein